MSHTRHKTHTYTYTHILTTLTSEFSSLHPHPLQQESLLPRDRTIPSYATECRVLLKCRECEECLKGITNIDPPTTNNFLVTIIKEETSILEINPPFYTYDNTYSFPITPFDPLAGVHNGLVNQAIQIIIKALVPNKSHCISLIVNNSVLLMAQTLTVTTTGIYTVEFLGVNVSSSDILEIEIYPGACN